MRYAAALSLARQLRAGVVPGSEIKANVSTLADLLRSFTSDVEPSRQEPGVFWLGASGLSRLYPSLDQWARLIHSHLTEAGFCASVTVGFSRFGTYAAAKKMPEREGVTVFENPEEEAVCAKKVTIDRLGFDPKLRDALAKLGITTLGAFLDLPAAGVRKRFGGDVFRLHELARGELFVPLQPEYPTEPAAATAILDYPETSLDRLMAVIESLLKPVLAELSRRDELAAVLVFNFVFDNGEKNNECIEPASPTLESSQLLDLVRLRLAGVPLSSGITDVTLEAVSGRARRRQRELFERSHPRDLDAANRALARIRADLGDGAVKIARLRDGHLPEASFEWEPIKKIAAPEPRAVVSRPLVRRIYSRPVALSRRRQREPRAALITLYEDRLVEERVGPYVVSGGWWVREVGREYYFVRTETGRRLWLYYDRRRQCWFLHGEVE
jgi:protein ImuB